MTQTSLTTFVLSNYITTDGTVNEDYVVYYHNMQNKKKKTVKAQIQIHNFKFLI